MKQVKKENTSKLKIIPLGGLEQIGMNITAFEYEDSIVVVDCGLSFPEDDMLGVDLVIPDITYLKNNIDKVKGFVITHGHEDHIGALPYILKEYPGAVVCGAEKSKSVFASEGAKKTMKRLGESARDNFVDSKEPVSVDGLRIDHIVRDGDEIRLSDHEYIKVLETKGHTDCSMTYVLEPYSIMFACESTGVLRNPQLIHTAILKSFSDTLESADKCKAYGAKHIIGPHYGIVPDSFVDKYFDLYKSFANEEKEKILYWYDEGMSFDELMAKYEEEYWSEERGKAQPKAAFLENAKYTIKHIVEVFKK